MALTIDEFTIVEVLLSLTFNWSMTKRIMDNG